MSEMSLDEIMSGRGEAVSDTPTPEAASAPAAPADGSIRDDKGRFAPKAEPAPTAAPSAAAPVVDPAAPAPEGTEARPNGTIPIQAFDAERSKRRELEERYDKDMRELRDQVARLTQPAKPAAPPAPPPSFWDAPDDFVASQLTPIQQQMFDQKAGFSKMLASDKHGAEVVDAALKAALAIKDTPEGRILDERLDKSIHPLDDMWKWHKEHSFRSDIGADPEAYKKRIIDEYIAAQQQQPQPATPAAPTAAPVLPTAFASKPTSGPRGGQEFGGPRSLSEIMKR